jgi:hypothetical protein
MDSQFLEDYCQRADNKASLQILDLVIASHPVPTQSAALAAPTYSPDLLSPQSTKTSSGSANRGRQPPSMRHIPPRVSAAHNPNFDSQLQHQVKSTHRRARTRYLKTNQTRTMLITMLNA